MSENCPFCNPDAGQLFFESELVLGLWDRFPVAPGHALLVTRRHVASWFEATRDEQVALIDGIPVAREQILRQYKADGFNLGVNAGVASGQTVPHLHLHVIRRCPPNS